MTPTPAPALSIRGLRKTYASGAEALLGIDLEVAPGDFFALLGPNGAGKSTAIGIVASLVTFREGRVAIFGRDILREPGRARMHLGLVPQEFNFNQFDRVDDIVVTQAGLYGVPRRAARGRAQELLEQVDLWGQRAQQARELSGGMKRRLMIARALAHRPRLLILDEPTAGVDLEVRRALWRYLEEINGLGTTIILTTHYLEEAERLCRNIAIIDRGRIRAHTTMRALLDQLDAENFVLFLDAPLARCPRIPGYALHHTDPRTLEATVGRGADLNGLLRALDEHGVRVRSMRNKTNRLEKLFLQLTGAGFETPA